MSTAEALSSHEIALWNRLLRADRSDLAPETARFLLSLKFEEGDVIRFRELTARNQAGALSPDEATELEGFFRVGLQLDLLRARALRALHRTGEAVADE